MAAPIAGTPVPQPIVKPRAEHAHRSFRSLTKDDASGPASLLAAVAALEAEEQVKIEPIVATISEPTGDPFLQGSAPAASGDDAHAEAAQGEDDDELDLSSLLDGQSHNGSPGAPDDFDSEPVEVYELDTTLLTTPDPEMGAVLPRQNGRTWPVLEELATAPAVESTPAKPADARDDMKQWMDIIEALKRDAEPLASKQPPPVVNVEDAATAQNASDPGHHDAAAGGKKKRKRGKGNPAQDEWGFFDPDQCGFAALIEKLEEITDKDDTPTPKRA
jgi:hypothetical protein